MRPSIELWLVNTHIRAHKITEPFFFHFYNIRRACFKAFSPDDRVISPGRVFTILIINLLFRFSLVRTTRRRAAGESWTTKIDTRVCNVRVWSGIARRAKREKRDARHCPRRQAGPRRSRSVYRCRRRRLRRKTRPTKMKTKKRTLATADTKNQLRSTLITRRRRRRMTTISTMIIMMQILLLINRAAPMGGRRSYECIFCFKRVLGRIGNDIAVPRYRATKLIDDH